MAIALLDSIFPRPGTRSRARFAVAALVFCTALASSLACSPGTEIGFSTIPSVNLLAETQTRIWVYGWKTKIVLPFYVSPTAAIGATSNLTAPPSAPSEYSWEYSCYFSPGVYLSKYDMMYLLTNQTSIHPGYLVSKTHQGTHLVVSCELPEPQLQNTFYGVSIVVVRNFTSPPVCLDVTLKETGFQGNVTWPVAIGTITESNTLLYEIGLETYNLEFPTRVQEPVAPAPVGVVDSAVKQINELSTNVIIGIGFASTIMIVLFMAVIIAVVIRCNRSAADKEPKYAVLKPEPVKADLESLSVVIDATKELELEERNSRE